MHMMYTYDYLFSMIYINQSEAPPVKNLSEYPPWEVLYAFQFGEGITNAKIPIFIIKIKNNNK